MPWNPRIPIGRRIDPGEWLVLEEGWNFFAQHGDFYLLVHEPTSSTPQQKPLVRLNSSVPPWHAEVSLEFGVRKQFYRWGHFFKAQVYNPIGNRPIYLSED